ncbi:hypothetical protein QQ045_013109 [Rhodiola kirilowii]
MKKLNKISAIICYLTLLLLHTPFSVICKSSDAIIMLASRPEDQAEMLQMEDSSEINRRVLMMQKSYISYATLRRDMTPCDRPGASYYNCRSTGVANPYTRGCGMIVGCAKDIRNINY